AAVSADGAIVAGRSGYSPARWTMADGMVGLPGGGGNPPGCVGFGSATAISADGRVIVGYCETDPGVGRSFIWTPESGLQDLQALLGNAVPGGWTLSRATGISADGFTIVGYEYVNRESRGWVVRFPRPPCWTGDMNCDGVFDALDL